MFRFLAPALVMVPLLNGVPTQAATIAMNDPLGILKSHAPIVKVEERCGNGYFRDGYGHCRYWYGGEFGASPPRRVPTGSAFRALDESRRGILQVGLLGSPDAGRPAAHCHGRHRSGLADRDLVGGHAPARQALPNVVSRRRTYFRPLSSTFSILGGETQSLHELI